MYSNKVWFGAAMTVAMLAGSNGVWAHAGIVPKDNLDAFSGRSFEEGSSAYLQISLGHGCDSEQGMMPTRHASVVFPNNVDLSGKAYTVDGAGNHFAGNAMFGIKPRVNGDWGAIRTIPGNVPTFYSHGEKSGDVRAIQWLDGFVPDSMYENLELKASLPKLEGCVGKLRVYTPVVQFCDSGLMNAWIKEPTNQFSADVISAGYAPYFDVVRNNTKNPLPESCGGVAETVEVYPSAEDIDSYLPVANPVANKASAERNDSQDNASLASVGWFSVLAAALLMLMRTRRRLG